MSTRNSSVSIRKIMQLGSSRVISLPRGFASNSSYVAIIIEGGRLIIEPLKVGIKEAGASHSLCCDAPPEVARLHGKEVQGG